MESDKQTIQPVDNKVKAAQRILNYIGYKYENVIEAIPSSDETIIFADRDEGNHDVGNVLVCPTKLVEKVESFFDDELEDHIDDSNVVGVAKIGGSFQAYSYDHETKAFLLSDNKFTNEMDAIKDRHFIENRFLQENNLGSEFMSMSHTEGYLFWNMGKEQFLKMKSLLYYEISANAFSIIGEEVSKDENDKFNRVLDTLLNIPANGFKLVTEGKTLVKVKVI